MVPCHVVEDTNINQHLGEASNWKTINPPEISSNTFLDLWDGGFIVTYGDLGDLLSSMGIFCDVTYGELIPIEIIRSSDKSIRQWRLAETGCWNLHKDYRATLGSIWCDEVMRFGNSWKTLSHKSFNSMQMSQSHEVLQATKFSSSNHGEEKMKIIAIKCWERPHGSKWFLSNLLEIHPAWSFGLSIFKIEIYWNATIYRKQSENMRKKMRKQGVAVDVSKVVLGQPHQKYPYPAFS